MHSGQNWTRKRTFKPDDEAQITTESEERQAVDHANWCVMSDIVSPAQAVGGVDVLQGGDRANNESQRSFQTTEQ